MLGQSVQLDLRRVLLAVAAGWALYLVLQTFYCAAVHRYVMGVAAGFADAVVWSVREWGVWLLLAPAAVWLGSFLAQRVGPAKAYVFVGLTAAVAALSYRVLLSVAESEASILASVIAYSPRQFLAVGLTGLAGLVLMRRFGSKADGTSQEPHQTNQLALDATLLVTRGSSEALIRVGEIDSIRAAGNYVELDVAGEIYLLRGTLSTLERRLPHGCFVRLHRCHIVRVAAIDRIQFSAAGNGSALLRNGTLLNISKSYARQLRESRFRTA